MSYYLDELKKLMNSKCPECGGMGKVNDAEPGDVRFSTVECSTCIGLGCICSYPIYWTSYELEDGSREGELYKGNRIYNFIKKHHKVEEKYLGNNIHRITVLFGG